MSSRVDIENCRWRDLCLAAILETDRAKLSQRIENAEWAILVRGHDLLNQPESALPERRALDAALNALRILKDYSKRTTDV